MVANDELLMSTRNHTLDTAPKWRQFVTIASWLSLGGRICRLFVVEAELFKTRLDEDLQPTLDPSRLFDTVCDPESRQSFQHDLSAG
jgi:hypothetical protein